MNRAVVVGVGKDCPKCFELMERRKHPENWKPTHDYFFTEWDFCPKCLHIQHYREFRNNPSLSLDDNKPQE